MKVIISVPGRFWAFDLAKQLLKRNYLEKLITSYPKFEVSKYGIPSDKVDSIIIKEILERGWNKLPSVVRNFYNPQFFISELFDKLTAKKIVPADIIVGYSNFSLHTFRQAKKLGMITVLERGSSHMLYQQQILKEEYERFGVKGELAHPKIIEKELQEYEAADYICVPSLFVKRTFLEKGVPENKLLHIPFGVDLSAFHQIPKTDNIFRIIFTGALSLRKGVHYLLQAFSELKLPNSELVLIGKLTEAIRPFLEKYKGSYKYLEHQLYGELYKYYSQGSIFVLMSIEEGLALVQAQAMACGLPVICTPNTGGEDVVRDGIDGFIIPIRDVKTLKEKLLYLYNDPEALRQMSQSAREQVATGFTWDDYGNKIVNAYQKVLQK